MKKQKIWIAVTICWLALLMTACGPDSLERETGSGKGHTGAWQSVRIFPDGKGWAITYYGLLHTNDRGKHWNKVTPWQSDTQSGTFISGVNNFVNSSVAWVTRPGNTVYQQYGKSNDPQLARVYRTNDGGRTWRSAAIPDTASSYSDIRSGPGAISGAFYPLGETRHQVGVTALSALNDTDAWISVRRFYTHTGGGQEEMKTEYTRIWHSDNGGKSWQLLVENKAGKDSKVVLPGLWSVFPDRTTGIENGLTFSTLMISRDVGKNWQEQTLPSLNIAYDPGATTQREPYFFDARTGVIPIQSYFGGHYALSYYMTRDGARTWQAGPTLYLSDYPQINYCDASHWFIQQKKTLYTTEDGGVHWTKLTPKIVDKDITSISFASTSEGWAVSFNSDSQDSTASTQDNSTALFHTIDGGKTWQEVNYQLV